MTFIIKQSYECCVVLTISIPCSIAWEQQSLGDCIHLIHAQGNGRGLLQQLVAMEIEVPRQYISHLNHILQQIQ